MPNLASAAATGDRRATLEVLRDALADAIDKTDSGRDIAALSKRLMEVMDELDGMPDDGEAERNAVMRQRRRAGARRAAGSG